MQSSCVFCKYDFETGEKKFFSYTLAILRKSAKSIFTDRSNIFFFDPRRTGVNEKIFHDRGVIKNLNQGGGEKRKKK